MPAFRSTSGLPESASLGPDAASLTPEKTDRNIAVLIFLLSLIYLYLFRRYTAMEPDEGIILQGAERILHGQTPYRDFFSFYTPGSYYLTAAALKLLGDSLMTARTVLAAGASLMSALTYLLARRTCSRGVSIAAAALATFTALPYRYLVLHNWDSTLCAMLALYVAVRYLEAPSGSRAFALGSMAAITVLFEQSKGAGLVIGLGLGFGILFIASRRMSGAGMRGEEAELFRRLSAHTVARVAGFAWPFLLVFAWFAHQHAVSPMISDWLWPLHHYTRANSVPYGYQNWSDASRATLFGNPSWGHRLMALLVITPCFLIPILPLIAVAIFFTLCYRALKAGSAQDIGPRRQHYLLVSAVITGLLWSVEVGRADILHFVYLTPILYLVLAWILDGRDVRSPLFKTIQPVLRVLIGVSFALLAAVLAVTGLSPRVAIATRRGEIRAVARDQVLAEIQAQVTPGSTILIYPYLPLYYYLTATFPPGPYDYLQPGMHTPEQQSEVVRDLARDGTRVVMFEYAFNEKMASSWPNTPLEAIANDRVADFLLSHYHSCGVLKSAPGWRFLFMIRKDFPCPNHQH